MQRSFDDLGTPLIDVTFCVVDLETTGGSPVDCGITEIGAVKVRGGQIVGTFQTLVNPGQAIPPSITLLTGITQAMVVPAPRVEAVLPSFIEFAAGCVLVGHNVRFDISFLNAALERHGWARLNHPVVDTCALARRLVRDEVPNCKLSTLAERFRVTVRPTHRALDDALATGEVLHHLIERASGWGVMTKLALTERLPRSPGVYIFRNRSGNVLYIGKATNLRSRVRSYFSGDDRRKVGPLMRELFRVDHHECASTLEASVLEARLIHQHCPPYNRQLTTWTQYRYVKLTVNEPFPRLVITKATADDGALYLGPVPSMAVAKRVIEALHTVTQLRRCTKPITARSRTLRSGMCTAAQLGVSMCPCSGELDQAAYRRIVDDVVTALQFDPTPLLDRLAARMHDLAATERFEEAADVRDRAAALSRTLSRQQQWSSLRRAERLVLDLGADRHAVLERGRLTSCFSAHDDMLPLWSGHTDDTGDGRSPVRVDEADELSVIASWLQAQSAKVRIVDVTGELSFPIIRLPNFTPT
jgi:DNA polymerase III subunit epsilon